MADRNPDIAFTRNPIYFKDRQSGDFPIGFSVTVGGSEVYSGSYLRPAVIDVSEIAEAYVAPIPSPEGTAVDESGALLQLEGSEEFDKRLVSVSNSLGRSLMTDFFAIPGGVSPQNFRRLKQLDSDIFAARLLDKRHNFFLTTRTHGWRIVMDETEVYPLVFINLQDEDCEVCVEAAGTDYTVVLGEMRRGIYALDLNAVRMQAAIEYGFICSVFDVCYDGYPACRIVIRETVPERDSTMVRFRNSLGVFELLHLSGQKTVSTTAGKPGQEGKSHDDATGRYVNVRTRIALTRTIEVDTGFRTDDEIRFILDMAASDEVYLRDGTGWVRAVPTIDKNSLQSPQLKPESLKVKFAIADEYDSQTPDIVDMKDFERPRVFSPEHSDEFN